jgi:hypothetical protein
MKDPIEALDATISRGLVDSMRLPPGGVVQRMSTATREALSRLTSDALANMRVPEYICRVGERRGRARLPAGR